LINGDKGQGLFIVGGREAWKKFRKLSVFSFPFLRASVVKNKSDFSTAIGGGEKFSTVK
jgi:hypothetical protein